jgi:hypothetical protein
MDNFNRAIKELLGARLARIEKHFEADGAFFHGPLSPGLTRVFRDFVENLPGDGDRAPRLVLLVSTPGGEVETVEKLVEIIRHHYREVFFVVPDLAMSAGTILCMSGDRIYMDYSSALGPIDPQVFNGKEWVPALGYLDKVEELLQKARDGKLTNAEFLVLQNQDLARLRRFEQARDLTVTLLKKWLVEYKFKDWQVHRTDVDKKGHPVTLDEKKQRAEEIARLLGNNREWHSHGRRIGPTTLRDKLRLEVHDYSTDETTKALIRPYNDMLTEYVARENLSTFLHHRNYF